MSPFASRLIVATALALCAPLAAQAASICTGAAPAPGVAFSGPVLEVLDGERLCVAGGPTPDMWVAVRPAGLVKASHATPRADRSVLMTATFAKRLDCVAGLAIDGAVQAVCTVQGAPLSEQIEAAGAAPAWQRWR